VLAARGVVRRVTTNRPPGSLRRWNRFAFRFFGPPSVGRYDGAYPAVETDPACPSCGRRESEHEGFRTRDGKTLRRCPA
jgi:hypothetical protein